MPPPGADIVRAGIAAARGLPECYLVPLVSGGAFWCLSSAGAPLRLPMALSSAITQQQSNATVVRMTGRHALARTALPGRPTPRAPLQSTDDPRGTRRALRSRSFSL